MRKPWMFYSVVAVALVCAPTAGAQWGACNQRMLEGVWSATCTGFTDLSKLVPGTPPGTMAPLSMISRGVIKRGGGGTREGFGSVPGLVSAIEMEEKFTINPDCTGEKTYTMKIAELNLTLSGKATFILMPGGHELQMMLLNPGDTITCEYKKMANSPLF